MQFKSIIVSLAAIFAIIIFSFKPGKVISIADRKSVNTTTIKPSRTLVTSDKLVGKNWLLDEVVRNIGGRNERYVRGKLNNTGVDYDNIEIHFDSDGTGFYTDEIAKKHDLKWKYLSDDGQNAEIVIDGGRNTFVWNMINVNDNYLYATSPYGADILVVARYKQVETCNTSMY